MSLFEDQKKRYSIENIIGACPQMRKIIKYIEVLSKRPRVNVFITGETGTGKGLIARGIHYSSCDEYRPFVDFNCPSISADLLGSELFGSVTGAFTDAKNRMGRLESADGGTLFLDELADMDIDAQASLLKAIDEQVFTRLGSNEAIHVAVRFISATNYNLRGAINNGKLRTDLYYRLNTVPIHLPPLRERGDDVILLAERFIDEFSERHERPPPLTLSDEAITGLKKHTWPGNVRELRNVIERVTIFADSQTITTEDIEFNLAEQMLTEEEPAVEINESQIQINFPPDGIPLDLIEEKVLETALETANWSQTKAARLLHISRDTLRYRVSKLGLKKPTE